MTIDYFEVHSFSIVMKPPEEVQKPIVSVIAVILLRKYFRPFSITIVGLVLQMNPACFCGG